MEKVENKISEEHLNKIQEHQGQLTELISRIGILESQKHHLLHEISSVNEVIEDHKKDLEAEYGAININVEDGTYTKVEAEKEVLETENV
tara:strand:+ start:1222 stop:1491 length:270 start_codon:yes stop_codon:yes gene_type:complete